MKRTESVCARFASCCHFLFTWRSHNRLKTLKRQELAMELVRCIQAADDLENA
jgi:hypothetical protein